MDLVGQADECDQSALEGNQSKQRNRRGAEHYGEHVNSCANELLRNLGER